MTYTFHVGEPASTRWEGRAGGALASAGPGGVQLLIALDEPGEAERESVESGPVTLGVQDGDRGGTVLIRVGEPGRSGHIEARAALDVGAVWWGADVELALCDAEGVVHAVRRFQGLEAGSAAEEALGELD